jgi:hypothetical protein
MRLSNPVLGVGKGTYFITGHGGSDLIQVTWGLENRDLSVRGDAGNDNIRIQNNAGKSISSLSGDQGNDVITIVASDNVGAFGGPGADSIRAIAGTKNPNVFLFQNGGDNQPDGNKDILDCSGIPLSTAKVNVADGDVAKNCDTVIAS